MRSIVDGRPPCAAVIVCLALVGSGCVLAPKGMEDERAHLRSAGESFELATDRRRLPELSPEPDWREVLRLAFLANGDLQAAYFEWKAALERVAVEAAYPNTNVSLGFEYLFSDQSMKSWDRTTLTVGFDPMQNLSFPKKVVVSGRAALEAARAAGKRFAAAKFELQRQVLTAYAEYALLAEKMRLQRELVALRRVAAESARGRLAAGGEQRDLVEAEMELRLAENDLENLDAETPEQRAALNALIGRDPTLALPPPGEVPPPRAIGADDATLLMVAVDGNPSSPRSHTKSRGARTRSSSRGCSTSRTSTRSRAFAAASSRWSERPSPCRRPSPASGGWCERRRRCCSGRRRPHGKHDSIVPRASSVRCTPCATASARLPCSRPRSCRQRKPSLPTCASPT
jgi:hypothetical protein